mmetsp:Transcript_90192/g.140869  ORF Transcript_90192/g.140869 Transcript_90192/m.140869 type:complete len:303 (-) Transcript_90192:65-973(-)
MTAVSKRQSLQVRSRTSLAAYNAVLVPNADTSMELSDFHPASSSSAIPFPSLGSNSLPSDIPPRRGSRLSVAHHERRDRARMSIAGYNYLGAMSVNPDAEDCSSTRDSTQRTDSFEDPWGVFGRWAADNLSDSGFSEDSETSSSASATRLSRQRSSRRSVRESLAGYNCMGAVSVPDAKETQNERRVLTFDLEDVEFEQNESRLPTIVEVGNAVFNLFSDPEEQRMASPGVSSIADQYEALDNAASESYFGAPSWFDDTDDAPDMGLQDDPIAEAGFIFAVEYGQSCAYAMTHRARDRISSS